MDFRGLIIILMSSVLVNNYVLRQFLGICPFLGVSKKLNQATGMGIAVTFVMLMATAVTWPIQYYVLDANGLGYLQTIVFILVIAALVQFTEIVLKKFIPALHKSLGVYLPLITTHCAVLGAVLLVVDTLKYETLLEAIAFNFSAALGFTLAIVLMAGVRERLETAPIPEFLKGFPIVLISAALISMAFVGLSFNL